MKATFYVQFLGTHNPRTGQLKSVKASRITQVRPSRPEPGAVLAKLTIDVPDAAFKPLEVEGDLVAEHVETIPAVSEPVEPAEEPEL